MRRAALVVALLAASPARAQFCPSYSVSAVPNDRNCGVEAVEGTNPTVAEWQPIFRVVAGGPAAWGPDGPAVADIGQGCGKPEPNHPVPAIFPCELLQAIAMAETSWRQFCVPTEPANKRNLSSRTIISFDCGYGVGQVTSGMHKGEMPAFDRARVAGEPLYNLATGTQILASKWRATQCVGDNQPRTVEHWYTAAWAYNGLAFSNNPNNPNYDAMRPPCDPSKGCGGRPYQEKVWGWMEHPPSPAHWTPLAVAYPNRGDIGDGTRPPALPEPDCAGPTDCAGKRAAHVSACLGGAGDGDGGSGGDGGGGDGDDGDGGEGDAGEGDGGVGGAGRAAGGCGCGVGGAAPLGAPSLALIGLVRLLARRRR